VGDRGGRRVSIDCTPPKSDALLYPGGQQAAPETAMTMVPLAMVQKGVDRRDFDIRDHRDRPLPVLGRRDSACFAASALRHLIPDAAVVDEAALATALRAIAFEPVEGASRLASELTTVGTDRGHPVLDPLKLPPVAARAMHSYAQSRPFIVLLRASQAGVRQVLKYSFHWHTRLNRARAWKYIAAAHGYAPLNIDIAIDGANGAESYHLEVLVPSGLACVGLELPGPQATPSDVAPGDELDAVIHAHGSFGPELDPGSTARLRIAVPRIGLRLTATLVALYTFGVFGLVSLVPGVIENLKHAGDGTVAVLLTAPALASALLNRGGENTFVGRALRQLRASVLLCTGMFLAATASIVGGAADPWLTLIWREGLAIAGILLVTFTIPYVRDLFSGADDAFMRRQSKAPAVLTISTIESSIIPLTAPSTAREGLTDVSPRGSRYSGPMRALSLLLRRRDEA
jgi:hypothetical protein